MSAFLFLAFTGRDPEAAPLWVLFVLLGAAILMAARRVYRAAPKGRTTIALALFASPLVLPLLVVGLLFVVGGLYGLVTAVL